MKKTLLTCMAVLALFAIAGSASAITCTVDQRPAATLLVPYFAVSLNDDSTILRDTPDSFDTLIAIGNASSAPMIAHVSVFNRRSTLVLDFNVALTGFDITTWRMSDVISGHIPSTPINKSGEGPDVSADPSPDDACQRNPDAAVYPASSGYLRVNPPCTVGSPPCNSLLTADAKDNLLATTAYPDPAFNFAFQQQVIDSLDGVNLEGSTSGGPTLSADSLGCGDDSVDGVTAGPAVGYVTIDMANYCSISNPSDLRYYQFNALGNENNLFGDIIFISGEGIGTYGAQAVAIESDPSFAGNPNNLLRTRTFYARYWAPSDITGCPNCGSLDPNTDLLVSSPWNVGIGDQREPLGLRWAARYFVQGTLTDPIVRSNLYVWRASSGTLTDLTNGGDCDTVEVPPIMNFYDEDENAVSTVGPGPCPSPCTLPPPAIFNFPFETGTRPVTDFTLPEPEASEHHAGWVEMIMGNLATGTVLDQAYVNYQFNGGAAFVSAHFPGIQLDPSACEPLDLFSIPAVGGPAVSTVQPILPVIPGGPQSGTIPPAGCPGGPLCVSTGVGP
jgi:hypothetical protein